MDRKILLGVAIIFAVLVVIAGSSVAHEMNTVSGDNEIQARTPHGNMMDMHSMMGMAGEEMDIDGDGMPMGECEDMMREHSANNVVQYDSHGNGMRIMPNNHMGMMGHMGYE